MLNGILVIDKDEGMTSADVVYHLRKALHIKKIGHAGTLDPDVTGVLPIAIGQATKLIELMHTKNKQYQGEGLFGYSTDSYDISGQVLEQKSLTSPLLAEQIQEQMTTFTGEITQVPPIYSAVRVNGKHLYEYARAGIEVERPKRQVTVQSYRLLGEPKFDGEKGQEAFGFVIECSKGTYVRSLVNDLGAKLGVPAVMTKLRRTASSGFTLAQAVKLDQVIAQPERITDWLQPLDNFFREYEQVDLRPELWLKVKNGAAISLTNGAEKLALRYNNKVKAIYQKKGTLYVPALMLLQNE
ncbi:tRNA pseudouridine(55) synthase TruB [Lactobacillus sp. ESL0791]|uniref:tRNA pseudouridine(55) synthase TruB n=1 Tax=Lactobacillus sp. ESL0791 TaxID=2983234 RepID=UPI0023F905E3|nr:tRNA pseudouridine(55) synthase TruB [Lactobacillus sp. ESL0791]MDF7639063.1 tRNA pseudouridine(55) synthase TruB [Lactobacillus sp. ESL0791]